MTTPLWVLVAMDVVALSYAIVRDIHLTAKWRERVLAQARLAEIWKRFATDAWAELKHNRDCAECKCIKGDAT